MSKKRFVFSFSLIVFCAFCTNLLFAAGSVNELSAQMESSYKSGFYPGVVRYAEEILRRDSRSIASFRAAVYEGESLFRMGRTEVALRLLNQHSFSSSDSEGAFLNSAKAYWLGRCLFEHKKFEAAQTFFFSSASLFKKVKNPDEKIDYFSRAMLWGARTYLKCGDRKNAVPLLEYVVANGHKFSEADFSEAFVSLGIALNENGGFGKADSLCQEILAKADGAGSSFAGGSEDCYFMVLLIHGDAKRGLGKFREAYDLYCKVLAEAPSFLAAQGMQKAYEVSSQHKAQIGSEPGAVLAQAEDRLSEYPDLLGEFWTRLAVDAYSSGDAKKALQYFDEAKTTASANQLAIAAVYGAQIEYEQGGKGKKSAQNAAGLLENFLESVRSSGKSEISEDSTDSVKINMARFYGYCENWNDCEKSAFECLSSRNEETARQAFYWASLSKYEKSDIKNCIVLIDSYRNSFGELDYDEDYPLLNLYAKALARDGKYSAADQIFYALSEKGHLNNDGRLDYSRTLLKGGHFISTKEQAGLASGDEAVYLSALASFNQRRWEEAEKGFLKTVASASLNREHVAYSRFYLGYAQYQLGEYEKSVSNLSAFIQSNQNHPLFWSANMTCARSAAFSKNYAKASSCSETAVKTAATEMDRQEAVLLNAGIYAESQAYDKALSVLSPFIAQKNLFGYECRFRSAEILVQKGELEAADAHFAALSSLSDKNALSIAEDSAYRRGEIQYSEKNYGKALENFELYLKKFATGKFAFAAVYFSADCMAKSGAKERAVLRYLQIVEATQQTTYRYGSEKNLVYLYEELGEYENGIKMAKKMIEEYGTQAVSDGIAEKAKELSKLADEASGKSGGKSGLKENATLGERAIARAMELRNSGENRKAAESYLEAVSECLKEENDRNAARAFYGAVEAFDAASLSGDAKATFEELKKRYPDDEYTAAAKKLMEGM